jgi:hypothetical protein
MRIIATIILTLAITVGVATMSSAQTVDGYTNQAGQIQAQVQGSADGTTGAAAPAATTDAGGSLPFTGLDLALLALAGGALVVVGLGMRSLTKAPESK